MGWLTPRFRPFIPGPDAVSLIRGWAPGYVWTDAENLAPTGIPPPDRVQTIASRYAGQAVATHTHTHTHTLTHTHTQV